MKEFRRISIVTNPNIKRFKYDLMEGNYYRGTVVCNLDVTKTYTMNELAKIVFASRPSLINRAIAVPYKTNPTIKVIVEVNTEDIILI